MPPDPDLHALVAGFADAAVASERGRPEYPPALVERVVAELGVPPGGRVLDLGAGTVCAEAFHWFDGDRAADELHRVLRPRPPRDLTR